MHTASILLIIWNTSSTIAELVVKDSQATTTEITLWDAGLVPSEPML